MAWKKGYKKREFNVGDYVLLFNSCLRFFAGKLLSKWEGPYIIEEVYRSGAIKINNFEGTNPKVVSGQRVKHYISGNPINVETNYWNRNPGGIHKGHFPERFRLRKGIGMWYGK